MLNEPIHVDADDLNWSRDRDDVNRILDNIELMHPRYLANLLKNGNLAMVIRRRLDWYQRTMARLEKALPYETYETLDEKARDCLGGTNLNWQDEQPLTKAEAKLLQAFREKYQI
jgi:hypothetical protein